jgi:hypothetical protein
MRNCEPRPAVRSIALGAALLLAGSLPAAGQGPEPVGWQQPREAPDAEPWFSRSLMFTLELGGAAYSDFHRGPATPSAGALDAPPMNGQRRVSARTTSTAGGSITWWAGDGWGIRIAGSYAPTRFSVWNGDGGVAIPQDRDSYARLQTWTGTTSAVFRLPFTMGRLVPYGFAGGGVVHHALGDREEVPPEAEAPFAGGSWTGAAALLGAGLVIPLQRRDMLMHFELSNHLTRTPLGGSNPAGEVRPADHPRPAPGAGPDADDVSITHFLRLTVGLTLPVRLP